MKHIDSQQIQAALLHRIEPARNMRRFYRLDLQPDLFGYWLLTREWGRIGGRGQLKIDSFDQHEVAISSMELLYQKKLLRGYSEAPR